MGTGAGRGGAGYNYALRIDVAPGVLDQCSGVDCIRGGEFLRRGRKVGYISREPTWRLVDV